MSAENTENTENTESGQNTADFEPESMNAAEPAGGSGRERGLEAVLEVPVQLALQVGQTTLSIRDLLDLVEGSVVELDRISTEPMDVLVNDKAVAKGEIVVVGENFGVRLTSVVNTSEGLGANA